MESISKTVRDRLAAQQMAADHPDADLLSAYAENTLVAQEREGITAHLARCETCRDVVLLAMPETQTAPTAAVVIPQRRWIARPVVRWLGAATAVLVVGTAVVVKKVEAPSPWVARRAQNATAVMQPAPSSSPSSSSVMAESTAAAPAAAPVAPAAADRSAPAADRISESLEAKKPTREPKVVAHNGNAAGLAAQSRREEAQSISAQPGSVGKLDRLDQYAKLQSPPNLKFDSATAAGAVGGPIRNNIVVSQQSAPAPPPPLYNLQVQAQSGTVQVSQLPAKAQPATGNGNNIINVSNAPAPQMPGASSTMPVAAPAAKDEEALAAVKRPPINAASAESSAAVISRAPGQAANSAPAAKSQGAIGGLLQRGAYNAVPNAACAIITDGIRCVQNNHKMEFHHPGANLKVIMSQGEIVWAGGDALVRSTDGGATWSDVKKPIGDTITRISIMPDAVYVGGAAGPLWKTADNGASWAQASPEPGISQK